MNGCGAVESGAYSDCCEHVLEFVDQRDEGRVIDIDSERRSQYQHPGEWADKALTNSPLVWSP